MNERIKRTVDSWRKIDKIKTDEEIEDDNENEEKKTEELKRIKGSIMGRILLCSFFIAITYLLILKEHEILGKICMGKKGENETDESWR